MTGDWREEVADAYATLERLYRAAGWTVDEVAAMRTHSYLHVTLDAHPPIVTVETTCAL